MTKSGLKTINVKNKTEFKLYKLKEFKKVSLNEKINKKEKIVCEIDTWRIQAEVFPSDDLFCPSNGNNKR